MSDRDVLDFFRKYARLSTGQEPDLLARLYDDSFLVAAPRGAVAFRNDSALLQWLRQVSEFNVRSGLTSMTPEKADEMPISKDYTLANVHWAATFKKTGTTPIRFVISYLLRRVDDGLKVIGYISHDDQEGTMREHGLL